ncbi:MAG: phosphotransferase [Acidimicrobiales bacterium]
MTSEPSAALGGAAELPSDRITTSTRDPHELGRKLERWLATVLPPGRTPRSPTWSPPRATACRRRRSSSTRHGRWTVDGRPTPRRPHRAGDGQGARLPPTTWRCSSTSCRSSARPPRSPCRDALARGGPLDRRRALLRHGTHRRQRALRRAALHLRRQLGGRGRRPPAGPTAGLRRAGARRHPCHHPRDPRPRRPPARPTGRHRAERHLAEWRRTTMGGGRSPLAAARRVLARLRANLPTDTSPDALSWGDARIGNMMFADFEVVAVLDWEMAGIAPPEVDLGWMAYLHLFFQDIATDLGLPGLPNFMAPADLVATYQALTGRTLGNLRWHVAYSAMRHGVIMRRVTERAILFGEAVEPPDLDDTIIHRATLRAMLDGTYWDRVGL